jgi:pyridoxamine 5'-phosphate oxidase
MPRRPDMPPLHSGELDPDPIVQFGRWFERAAEQAPLAEAMTLATVGAGGAPDARMVLLKGWDDQGFRFFTNRASAKGEQLRERSLAALVLYWRELDRQVRIRGPVEELGESESDEYFATRPRASQLGAWASPQSEVIGDRAELDGRLAEAERRFADAAVERPPHWGGYRVRPAEIEFWQGQVGRLHDRFRYRRTTEAGGEGWHIERLAP